MQKCLVNLVKPDKSKNKIILVEKLFVSVCPKLWGSIFSRFIYSDLLKYHAFHSNTYDLYKKTRDKIIRDILGLITQLKLRIILSRCKKLTKFYILIKQLSACLCVCVCVRCQ